MQTVTANASAKNSVNFRRCFFIHGHWICSCNKMEKPIALWTINFKSLTPSDEPFAIFNVFKRVFHLPKERENSGCYTNVKHQSILDHQACFKQKECCCRKQVLCKAKQEKDFSWIDGSLIDLSRSDSNNLVYFLNWSKQFNFITTGHIDSRR